MLLTCSEVDRLWLCTFPGLKLSYSTNGLRYRSADTAPHCFALQSLDIFVGFCMCRAHIEICFHYSGVTFHNCRGSHRAKNLAYALALLSHTKIPKCKLAFELCSDNKPGGSPPPCRNHSPPKRITTFDQFVF